jgi:hypothetical protein
LTERELNFDVFNLATIRTSFPTLRPSHSKLPSILLPLQANSSCSTSCWPISCRKARRSLSFLASQKCSTSWKTLPRFEALSVSFSSLAHLLMGSATQFTCLTDARLDGSTSRPRRALDIKLFQQSNSPYSVYFISTRAGGLGINLTGSFGIALNS